MGIVTMATSARDGLGKTTSCVFLADALSADGAKSTLIVELDSRLRSLDILSGVSGSAVFDIHDIFAGRCSVESAIIKAPSPRSGVFVLCAPYKADEIDPNMFLKLCTLLSDKFDRIIVDTSSMCPAAVAASTLAMNTLLFATADPVGVRDGRILYEQLCDMSVPDIRLVMSRVVPSRMGRTVPHLDYCIDNIGAKLIGVIPESDLIAVCSSTGKRLPEKTTEIKIFKSIAARMEGADTPPVIR